MHLPFQDPSAAVGEMGEENFCNRATKCYSLSLSVPICTMGKIALPRRGLSKEPWQVLSWDIAASVLCLPLLSAHPPPLAELLHSTFRVGARILVAVEGRPDIFSVQTQLLSISLLPGLCWALELNKDKQP